MGLTEQDNIPKIWWCNQGGTYQESKAACKLWAPLKTRDGQTPWHWDLLEKVSPGDVVVGASNRAVRAICRATSHACLEASPWEFRGFRVGRYIPDGRCVSVAYHELRFPIPVKEIANDIMALGLERGPFTKAGTLRQAYLTRFHPKACVSLGQRRLMSGQVGQSISFEQPKQ